VGVAPVTGPDPWSIASAIGITVMDLGSVNAPPPLEHGSFRRWLVNLSFQPGRERKLASRGGGWARRAQAVEDFGSLLNVATA